VTITLLTIGKVKIPWVKEGCTFYLKRLQHSCKVVERVLAAGEQEEEREKVRRALENVEGMIVVLDERGKNLSSPELAHWIGKQKDIGMSMTFVLGGAYGLDDRIRAKAHLVLSLGRITLPHELCTLVFLEQLYRAYTILAGSGYHHAD
jgi:23S rRNA (pseudouridine1915-N3)-methyltransferase